MKLILTTLVIAMCSLNLFAEYNEDVCHLASRESVDFERQIEEKTKQISDMSIQYGQKTENMKIDTLKTLINQKIEDIRILEVKFNEANESALRNCQ